jgi:uncharacterized protein involved in oxidation of intracellular sulfur
MDVLLVINGAAYGSDVTYNAIRLAGSLARREGVRVRVFLMGDGVTAAVAGQKTPDGYYKLDRMLSTVVAHDGEVGCCRTCIDARGITDSMLIETARRSSLEELTDWTLNADKVLAF